MTRYKITLEYDGTNLIGWQENIQGPSVQSVVKDAIEKFCGVRPDVVGAGRTDAGVHAIAMTAHFDLERDFDADTVMRAVNFYLINQPVVILSCVVVPDDFHARFSCVARHYKYVVLNRSAAPVLNKNRVWWVPKKLDVSKMQNASQKLIGRHDFTSFRASACQAKSPVKTLDRCEIKTDGDFIIFEFSARSFLHHQVRNMVGTLVEIGSGHDYDMDEVFAACNRSAAGATAPSQGLYFVSADYATID
ncbi:MAG: tRNA pseudouridine(38-40) synthase TruA [Alphaproteobacteria bacterium]|nr:tRNA pseudouridine(38-40) synthase TruA [Alphaproteobacteria bacterium]